MKQKFLGWLGEQAHTLAPLALIALIAGIGYLTFPDSLTWTLAHITFIIWAFIFILLPLSRAIISNRRRQAAQERGRVTAPKDPYPPYAQAWRDWFDLVIMLDTRKRRITYAALTLGVIAIGVLMPTGRTAPNAPTLTNLPDDLALLAEGWEFNGTTTFIALAAPLIWFLILAHRCRNVTRARAESINLIYNMASNTLKYPRKARGIRKEEIPFQSANGAIKVKKWNGITKPEIFWITAPVTLDVNDMEPWNTLQANLDKRLPAENGWHFEFDKQGRGVTVMPSQYPMSIIWEGQQHPDPLTYYVGADLDAPGELLEFTFSDTSPHSATVGGTGSGKASHYMDKMPGMRDGVIGYYRNYEYEIGDYLFDPETGAPTQITAFSDWMQEQVYRVHLSDGSYKDVSADHRWTTYDRAARRSESRGKIERNREGWLSADQISALHTEAEFPSDDHISLKELATLAGLNQPNKVMYELASAVGVSKEQTIMKECHYPAQTFEQRQNVVVFADRKKTLNALLSYYENSRNNTNLTERREVIASMKATGSKDITGYEMSRALGVDWSNLKRTLIRAGVEDFSREMRLVTVSVPEKTVMKEHGVVNFYPRRDMCLALAEMGADPWHDQRHLRAMPKVRTTAEILETLNAGEYTNHSLKATTPVQFPEHDLHCDPYVVGAWLGDGITNAMRWDVSYWASEDPELLDEMRAVEPSLSFEYYKDAPSGNSAIYRSKGFSSILPADAVREDAEWSKSGLRKQVPEAYLFGSVDQRWSLLQGLMDTDGSVTPEGNCEFYQSDRGFAEQVRSLVLSLGMVATLRERDAGYVKEGERVVCRVAWTVAFTPPVGARVFRLARKQGRLDASEDVRREFVSGHRYVVDVEVLDSVEKMRCIAVDAPSHQFLLGEDFVPTHNTSVTEAIVAQAATKPMPWSAEGDPLYAQTYIIDPKGPFANRWSGRPNIHVVNGTRDTSNEEGDSISGIEAMSVIVDEFTDLMNARGQIIDDAGLAKWLDFSDEKKRELRLVPYFICLDEYLDHTDKITSKSEQATRDNEARQVLTEKVLLIARKGRSFGFHIMLIAQMANMTAIGSALMRQLIARIIMGNMDVNSYQTFFGTTDVPLLPTQKSNGKGIPGRGRLMNAPGTQINRMQAFWFGGEENSETLDQFLPKAGAEALAGADEDEEYQGEPLQAEPVVDSDVESDPEPEKVEEVAPEPEKPKKKPAPKKEKPKESETVEADDLFTGSDEGGEECMVGPHVAPSVRKCDNPKCENKVCKDHKQSPDGSLWVCPDCGKKHVLTKNLGQSLYPWVLSTAKRAGASVAWSRMNPGVEVLVRMEGVEIVKITGVSGDVKSLNGTETATSMPAVRKMVQGALK